MRKIALLVCTLLIFASLPVRGIGAEPIVSTQETDALQLLRASTTFAGVDEESLTALARAATLRIYGNGEPVMTLGERGDSLFLLANGEFEVTGAQGKAVAQFGRGTLLGEYGLLTGEPRSAGVRAIGAAGAYELPRAQLQPVLAQHPELIDRMAQRMAQYLARRPGLPEGRTVDDVAAELARKGRERLVH